MFNPEKVKLMSEMTLYMQTEAREDPVVCGVILSDGAGKDIKSTRTRRLTPAENAACSVICCIVFAALALVAYYYKAGNLDLITGHITIWLFIMVAFTAVVTVVYVKIVNRAVRSKMRDSINTTYRYEMMSEKLTAIIREEDGPENDSTENRENRAT